MAKALSSHLTSETSAEKRRAPGTERKLSRQPRAVLCGSYRRGIPSLMRAYEKLSAAGLRVLSPSGFDFVVEIDGFVLNQDEVGIPPEVTDRLRLNCIRTADLVWLHAPDGYVELSGASEIRLCERCRGTVYADECPATLLCARW